MGSAQPTVGSLAAVALGAVHSEIPVYGSGGVTSYNEHTLVRQLRAWVVAGIGSVKIKVGRDLQDDLRRVRAVRAAIGNEAELLVDANGPSTRKDALLWAQRFAEQKVRCFEEPVSSDDLEELRILTEHGPAGMSIAAGEYGCICRTPTRRREGVPAFTPVGNRATSREVGSPGRTCLLLDVFLHHGQGRTTH